MNAGIPGSRSENIDGEALLWAHSRLLQENAKNRVLVVLSDGAPVDDSTLSVNNMHYLHDHLIDVVSSIEQSSSIKLRAIGILHDASTYYREALIANDEIGLGETLIQHLSNALNPKL